MARSAFRGTGPRPARAWPPEVALAVGGVLFLTAAACRPSARVGELPGPAAERGNDDAILARAIEMPDPPLPGVTRVSATSARERDKIVVDYCVNDLGATSDFDVSVSSGSEELDELVLDTVASWRFEPSVHLDRRTDPSPQVAPGICSRAYFVLPDEALDE